MTAYEQISVGNRFECGSHRFSAEEIKRFANVYDRQSFHTDEEAAKGTLFGALCASGWHTAAVMMRCFVGHFSEKNDIAKATGKPAPPPGPSLGVDDLKWMKPVYVDDEISFAGHILAKRESASRPGWGIVSIEMSGANQRGEPVFSCIGHIFVARIEAERQGK
jgi:acyl dehydratase